MRAGALHTILTDGVWTPKRANKIMNIAMAIVCFVVNKNAGLNHLWWECRVLNKHANFGYLKLNQLRNRENNQPE
eukprot:16441644-Heterocapsa_arctica.AAC.1